LRFGDIIELGEVRFRFCSIHEDLQALLPKLPATSEQKSPASLSSNAMIVIATVLILIGGGAIWVMTRSAKISEQTKAQKLDPPDLQKPPEHIKSKEISIQEEQQKQLKLAEDMFEQENYDVAVVILDKLLVQRADWQEAKKLKQRIEYEQTQLKHIQTSIALQIEGKMLQAYETLDQIHKESRFFDRASDSKKEIAPKAVDELMHKVQEAIEHKQYINALQLNNQARDILPLHPKAKEFHEQLEQLIPKISEGNMLSSNKSMPRVTTSSALPKPRRGLSPVDKCQTLIRNKRYQSAKNCLDALVKQLGQKAPSQVHFLLGETTAQLGQCFDVIEKQKHILCFEAREHYRRYLKLAPNTPSAAKVRKMLNTTTTTPPKD
jgi:tetratricopeptide (TPR) repeat protein